MSLLRDKKSQDTRSTVFERGKCNVRIRRGKALLVDARSIPIPLERGKAL